MFSSNRLIKRLTFRWRYECIAAADDDDNDDFAIDAVAAFPSVDADNFYWKKTIIFNWFDVIAWILEYMGFLLSFSSIS